MLPKKKLTTLAKARFCRKQALEKKALDPLILDLRKINGPSEYFLICSAESEPQVKAIVSQIEQALKEECGERPIATDGTPASGWIVIDYGDLLIHVFHVTRRAYYRLEDLWSDAKTV